MTSARVVGPTFGYMLGSACLSIYVDPGHAPTGITEKHQRWLGAWWIGFVVIASLLMVFAPWLTLFPGRFQGKDETDAGRLEKSDSKEEQPKNLTEWFHESKAVAKRLGSSKVYVLNNISGM